MGPIARTLAEEKPLKGICLLYITPLRALIREPNVIQYAFQRR